MKNLLGKKAFAEELTGREIKKINKCFKNLENMDLYHVVMYIDNGTKKIISIQKNT